MSHLCFFWHGLRRHQPMKSPHIVAGYIAQCLCVLCDNLLLNIQPARQRIIATQTMLTHFAGVRDICVCHSTTLVARWSISWQHHSADWQLIDNHCHETSMSLHAQHVPLTVYFNFVGYRPATSIYLSNQSIFPTPSFVSWPGTCSWTTLLFCYLTVLSPTHLHECLSLVQCVTTLLSEAIGYTSSFFSLTFSFRQQIVIVKYGFWIPLSLDACCIPPVSILLTSSLHQQCVTMWPGLPQLYRTSLSLSTFLVLRFSSLLIWTQKNSHIFGTRLFYSFRETFCFCIVIYFLLFLSSFLFCS